MAPTDYLRWSLCVYWSCHPKSISGQCLKQCWKVIWKISSHPSVVCKPAVAWTTTIVANMGSEVPTLNFKRQSFLGIVIPKNQWFHVCPTIFWDDSLPRIRWSVGFPPVTFAKKTGPVSGNASGHGSGCRKHSSLGGPHSWWPRLYGRRSW